MNVRELGDIIKVGLILLLLAQFFCARLRRLFPHLRRLINNPEQRPWRRRSAQNLSQWVEIATRQLVTPAQTCIRAEIQEHFADAVQLHLANSRPEAEAQAAALADLGNAYAAARRFNREHLTQKDAAEIAPLLNLPQPAEKPGSWMCNLALIMIVSVAVVAFLFPPPAPEVWEPLQWEGMALLLLVVDKINRCISELSWQKTAPAVLRQMLLLKSLRLLCCVTLYFSFFYDQIVRTNGVWDGPLGAFLFYGNIIITVVFILGPLTYAFKALSLARIRRKLDYTGTDELDLPPQNPSVA